MQNCQKICAGRDSNSVLEQMLSMGSSNSTLKLPALKSKECALIQIEVPDSERLGGLQR